MLIRSFVLYNPHLDLAPCLTGVEQAGKPGANVKLVPTTPADASTMPDN